MWLPRPLFNQSYRIRCQNFANVELQTRQALSQPTVCQVPTMIFLWPSFPENQTVVPSLASFPAVPPAEDPRPPLKRLGPGEHIYAAEVEPAQIEPLPWTVNLSMTLSDASLISFPVGDECVIEAPLHHDALFGCSYLTRVQSPLIDTVTHF